MIPVKFLRNLGKMGPCITSVVNMGTYARKIKYKALFSNIELCIMKAIIITDQPIDVLSKVFS
jgi:hypothetical protein